MPRSPSAMAAASDAGMMPVAPSICTCAMLATTSQRRSRRSVVKDEVNSRRSESGGCRKRPPHILCGVSAPGISRYRCTSPDRMPQTAADLLRVDLREHPRGEPPQVDEPVGILLIIDGIVAEGSQVLPVERVWGGPPDHRAGTLEQLHPHRAGHSALRRINEAVERLSQRGEPLTVVDDLRVPRSDHRQIMLRVPVDGDRFQIAMRRGEDGPPGCLVDAANLNPYQAVFDHVHPAHPMQPAEPVESFDQRDGVENRLVGIKVRGVYE